MKKRYENSENKFEKKDANKQVTGTANTIPKILYTLPDIFAGEYAETLSVYTDKNGSKALVPPGWTVSGVPNESIILGNDTALIIYYIPKSELKKIDWKNPELLKKAKETYKQNIWLTTEILNCCDSRFEEVFLKKYGKRRGIYDKFQLVKNTRQKLWQHHNVKKYNGVYI